MTNAMPPSTDLISALISLAILFVGIWLCVRANSRDNIDQEKRRQAKDREAQVRQKAKSRL